MLFILFFLMMLVLLIITYSLSSQGCHQSWKLPALMSSSQEAKQVRILSGNCEKYSKSCVTQDTLHKISPVYTDRAFVGATAAPGYIAPGYGTPYGYSTGEGNGTPLQYSCLESPMDRGAWWAAVLGVTESRTRLSNFTFAFHFHALEKEMATHSSVLAWRIPGTGEPGRLPSMGSHRVGHD